MFFIWLFLEKKVGGQRAPLEKRSIHLAIELSLREVSYVLYVHELLCAR